MGIVAIAPQGGGRDLKAMNLPLAFLLLPLDSKTALYIALFGILIFSGLGLPVPEEITLLLGGYLAYLGFIKFWPTVYILIAGIIVADIFGYFLGRCAGEWISSKFLRFRAAALLHDKAEWYFKRHGEKLVLFSRPLIGVRVAVPMLAGHFRMNFVKFLLFDSMAAIPWTFILVSLSYYLGSGLDLITEIREIKHLIFILIWALIVIYAVRLVRSSKKD